MLTIVLFCPINVPFITTGAVPYTFVTLFLHDTLVSQAGSFDVFLKSVTLSMFGAGKERWKVSEVKM